MPKSGKEPSKDLPGDPPAGRLDGVGLCCACAAAGDVSTEGGAKYYSCDYDPGWYMLNKCHLSITRTATGGVVTIKKTYSVAYSNGATEADDKSTITNAMSAAMREWTSKAARWRVEIKQPGCDTQRLRMQFNPELVTSGADVRITADKIAGTDLRSYVSGGTAMNFYLNGTSSVDWVMAHEIGHTLGLVDEYTYDRPAAAPAPLCTWRGADDPDKVVTLSTSSIPAEPGKFGFDNATVMGQDSNTIYPGYLFYWVSIEVKRIMAANGTAAEVRIVAA